MYGKNWKLSIHDRMCRKIATSCPPLFNQRSRWFSIWYFDCCLCRKWSYMLSTRCSFSSLSLSPRSSLTTLTDTQRQALQPWVFCFVRVVVPLMSTARSNHGWKPWLTVSKISEPSCIFQLTKYSFRGVDPFGTGGHVPPIFGLGGHYHECPPPIFLE